ncbi:hypothetical protein B0T12DRAFT_421896 [Alternaria alternata]|nr:hypothetical protein B0T12DRAFT_421896 [Alternaria alternata]
MRLIACRTVLGDWSTINTLQSHHHHHYSLDAFLSESQLSCRTNRHCVNKHQ